MRWVSWPLHIFVFLAWFSALWWANIWPKMVFPDCFEKLIGSIHFIPGIYPYGVSLLIPVHFHVPSLIFGPLVAKYLAENGVSGIFFKNCCFHSFTLLGLTPIHFRVRSLIFVPLVTKYLAENGFFGTFWKNYWLNSFHTWHLPLWLKNINLYWIFLDEVGSDQSRGILSPFMGTACWGAFQMHSSLFEVHSGGSGGIQKCYATWIVPWGDQNVSNVARIFLEYSDCSLFTPWIFRLQLEHTLNVTQDLSTTSKWSRIFWTCAKHLGQAEESIQISGKLLESGQQFWNAIQIFRHLLGIGLLMAFLSNLPLM